MRIILIHNFYKKPGGEDVVFLQEAELLRKNGHEVECIVFNNKVINTAFKSFLYFFKSIYNSQSAKVLKNRIENFKPDIIHIHNTFLVASPSLYIAAKNKGIPVVQTLHNYRLICPSATLFHNGHIYTKSIGKIFPINAILKGVYRNSIPFTFMVAMISAIHKIIGTYRNDVSKFVALNSYSRNLFLKSSLKLKDSQIVVKPNFLIDPGKIKLPKEDYFIYVGRLEPEKGVKTLLNAFKSFNRRLIVIGDGSLAPMVRSCENEYDNIEYLGFLERADILNYIRKSRALIFSSEWYETFGLTIIEAFACFTPVIISDIGGHSKMVEEGKNGFHFECGESDDLIRALKKYENHEDKVLLEENSRKEFELKYTDQKNYLELINLYKSLLN